MTDAELLDRHARTRDDAALAELVRRHADLVYCSARRHVDGDHHRAQELTQTVFLALARQAATLRRHPVLIAWLHQHTRFAASKLRQSERRRRVRETTAATDPALVSPASGDPPMDWSRVEPLLDDALATIGERDRETILLRYFAHQPYAEIGQKLGLAENAARMRTDRALEKLRRALAARGVTSTATALGLALTGHAVSAAPASVATSTLAALGTASTAGVATTATSSAAAFFSTMTTSTKVALGVSAALALLIIGGVIGSRLPEQPRPAAAPNATVQPHGDSAATVLIAQQREHIADLEQRLAKAETLEVFIPLTSDEVAKLAGDIRRRTLLFQETYPLVPRDTDHGYDRYLFDLRELLVDSVPLQAQAIVAQRQVGTAAGAADFQAAYLKTALKLDDTQAAEVHRLLLAGYTTFFERNYPSAGRPSENPDAWWSGRRQLNRETTAAIAAQLSPMQQAYFRQIAADYLMFYTNFSYPSGVQY
jgi:RNA polymerase sigma factor (sigma-70 family)